MEDLGNRRILLKRMDGAFSGYAQEAEKLSVLLAGARVPITGLLKQRTAEVVAYKYRNLKDDGLLSVPLK